MDVYALIKFLHILAAIVWLGGGFCLLVLAIIADQTRDDESLLKVMRWVVMLGNRMFVPAALATLLFGGILVWMAWSITDFWIVLALSGFAASFLLGTLAMKPRADRLTAAADREGASPTVIAQSRALLSIAKFDYVILFMIVAVMVLKPEPGDYGTLASLAIVLVLGGVAFLAPERRAIPAA